MTGLIARGRSIAALGLLLAAALGLLASTQPWGSVALVDGRTLDAPGQQLAPGLTMTAFAWAALALVLPLAGRVWRWILGALGIVLGAAAIATTLAAKQQVGAALDALVAEATGLAGTGHASEVVRLTASGWPDAGLVAGALAVLLGLWVLATSHRWPARAARTARYERGGSGLAWDVMDEGEDPTR
ncbi:Trp biosynthesis-associated membrane protein [Agrococcus sp. 1P02AA]|uniref:Trp biosynthesis-associated membrane protein n=1 Tax=Agrococcus sp. 1P02AA TaxID=3132259 RepID=UPI0039A64743